MAKEHDPNVLIYHIESGSDDDQREFRVPSANIEVDVSLGPCETPNPLCCPLGYQTASGW